MDAQLREEVMQVLYAAFHHRDRSKRYWWVMSQEWFDAFFVDASWMDAYYLIGIPVEIRDDAGFPKLEQAA